MNILVLAATRQEIALFLEWLEKSDYAKHAKVLITGPGIFLSSLRLTETLIQNDVDFILNAGIAGAFIEPLPMGKVFQVEKDTFGDFGARDKEKFLDIFSLELLDPNAFPFENGWIHNPYKYPNLPIATGITVNTVSGDSSGIKMLKEKYQPDLESMEGAAIAFIAREKNIPYLQIRAVSNLVEPRNREAWNIPVALNQLNQSLISLFPVLVKKSI